MRLIVAIAAAVVAVGAAAAGNGQAQAAFTDWPSQMSHPASTRLQVLQDEWYLRPSRDRVKAGLVKVETVNFGEDDHDLVIATRKGKRVTRIRTLTPGQRTTRTVRLRRGSYKLYCTLPGHRRLGMSAVIEARR